MAQLPIRRVPGGPSPRQQDNFPFIEMAWPRSRQHGSLPEGTGKLPHQDSHSSIPESGPESGLPWEPAPHSPVRGPMVPVVAGWKALGSTKGFPKAWYVGSCRQRGPIEPSPADGDPCKPPISGASRSRRNQSKTRADGKLVRRPPSSSSLCPGLAPVDYPTSCRAIASQARV
ncbi:hypothetical protein FZEAL_6782 [Fusarium zealandicum]|uniref:Uncharacterized protein n=1 Tax=Fusarium zealandicum TaxID=1053134 RepID=A0A8H4UH83_9HYPO|nr:hypothetical protein FZEAL_6782 [Fusarium zealandicum]